MMPKQKHLFFHKFLQKTYVQKSFRGWPVEFHNFSNCWFSRNRSFCLSFRFGSFLRAKASDLAEAQKTRFGVSLGLDTYLTTKPHFQQLSLVRRRANLLLMELLRLPWTISRRQSTARNVRMVSGSTFWVLVILPHQFTQFGPMQWRLARWKLMSPC